MDTRKLVAEAVGTFLLVFFAVGVATESFGFKLFGSSVSAGVVTTALAFGLVLLALAYTLGPISGCHVNPAVTMGFVVSGRMPLDEAVGYWVAQFVGGIAGALVLFGVVSGSPTTHRRTIGLGADGFGANSMVHLDAVGAFAAEGILTLLFVFVVLVGNEQARHTRVRRSGHRTGLDRGAPHRHPPDRHVGQPGPQPRTGAHRRAHRAEPAVALHRGSLVGGALAALLYILLLRGRQRGQPRHPDGPGRPPEVAFGG
jgi:glycerol uptake facilitator-like aquaporin